jgi:hypothetical protein
MGANQVLGARRPEDMGGGQCHVARAAGPWVCPGPSDVGKTQPSPEATAGGTPMPLEPPTTLRMRLRRFPSGFCLVGAGAAAHIARFP